MSTPTAGAGSSDNHRHDMGSGNDAIDRNLSDFGKLGLDDGEDLTVFVQDMLDQIQSRFTKTGDGIRARMDEMGRRMDDLEASISELMEQANLESPDGASLTASQSKSSGASNSSRATPRADAVL